MLHLSLKFRLSENVSKRDAFLARVAKQWIVKDGASYRSQSERAKIAIHWFGKYQTCLKGIFSLAHTLQIALIIPWVVFLLFFLSFYAEVRLFLLRKTCKIFSIILQLYPETQLSSSRASCLPSLFLHIEKVFQIWMATLAGYEVLAEGFEPITD